jgi:hypothetical protein
LQYGRAVIEDLIVPETENAPASSAQIAVSLVMIARVRMLAAIGLDDQPRFNADEVGDVGWNGELAAELPAKLASPQVAPQEPLGVRHVKTKGSRPIV